MMKWICDISLILVILIKSVRASDLEMGPLFTLGASTWNPDLANENLLKWRLAWPEFLYLRFDESLIDGRHILKDSLSKNLLQKSLTGIAIVPSSSITDEEKKSMAQGTNLTPQIQGILSMATFNVKEPLNSRSPLYIEPIRNCGVANYPSGSRIIDFILHMKAQDFFEGSDFISGNVYHVLLVFHSEIVFMLSDFNINLHYRSRDESDEYEDRDDLLNNPWLMENEYRRLNNETASFVQRSDYKTGYDQVSPYWDKIDKFQSKRKRMLYHLGLFSPERTKFQKIIGYYSLDLYTECQKQVMRNLETYLNRLRIEEKNRRLNQAYHLRILNGAYSDQNSREYTWNNFMSANLQRFKKSCGIGSNVRIISRKSLNPRERRETCPICMKKLINADDEIVQTTCDRFEYSREGHLSGHYFHRECLDTWLEENEACPFRCQRIEKYSYYPHWMIRIGRDILEI